jgi:DMSO/TMAO reductase YedYZ molybdopterin-dependent catalytic subunit
LVENPVKLYWDDFNALPQSELTTDIHCVTSWSRYDNDWRGVRVADLLALVRPTAEAKFALFQSYDTYTTNLPLEEFAAPDALLATHWQGEPLTLEHGGPVRVVVPKLYFWKSAKWVKRIILSKDDRPGFWEVRGYHNHGDPWMEERYS